MPPVRDASGILLGFSTSGAIVTPTLTLTSGKYTIGGTETPWGRSSKDGIEWSFEFDRRDIAGAGRRTVEKSFIIMARGSLTTRHLSVNLLNVRDTHGLPASRHTGDLAHATTPTEEQVAIFARELGTVAHFLYAIGVGPRGPRKVWFPRCTVQRPPRLVMNDNQEAVLETVWTLEEGDEATPSCIISDLP